MLVAVYFKSVYQANRDAGDPSTVVISIRDRHFTPRLKRGFKDILQLRFDDHDPARDGANDAAELFSAEHASAVRAWLDKHMSSSDRLVLMIHCRAGVSRSASLAYYVHRRFGVPLKTTYPVHYLNRHVLHMLDSSIAPPALPVGAPSAPGPDFARFFDEDDRPSDQAWRQGRHSDR